MKTVNFDFKGLLCPVFTPITADRKTINYDVIEKYCCWLKQKGIRGVLVNGAISEGCCLRIDERKRITEEWVRVCRKNEMICMVQIGGCSITDVHDLAEHAEKIGVCAVVCWPDLFFRPTCEEDLVEYLRDISKHCPTRPLYYDHHPEKTAVWCEFFAFFIWLTLGRIATTYFLFSNSQWIWLACAICSSNSLQHSVVWNTLATIWPNASSAWSKVATSSGAIALPCALDLLLVLMPAACPHWAFVQNLWSNVTMPFAMENYVRHKKLKSNWLVACAISPVISTAIGLKPWRPNSTKLIPPWTVDLAANHCWNWTKDTDSISHSFCLFSNNFNYNIAIEMRKQ